MKKGALALFLIILISAVIFSQTYRGKGRLLGTVNDEQGNPIEGVTVKLFSERADAGFEVLTDAEGRWTASWIRGGPWKIDFLKVGYMPETAQTEVNEFKRNPEINIIMKKAEGLLLTDELKAALKEGNVLYVEGRYDEAIQVYQSIIDEYPDVYVIYMNIGNAYFVMEKYDEAEAAYMKVLEQDPDNNDAKLAVGNCYQNRGNSEKALEWYNQIEFENIKDPTVLYNIGTNFYNLAKFEDALKYYQRAVELKEDFADGLYQLGLAYLNLTKYKESIDVFEKYLEVDSESGRADQVRAFIEFLKTKI
jgi:tetratricopeptide (TPR) repeat protein